MVTMYRFAKVSFKTELVMDFQFNSMEACKFTGNGTVNIYRFANVSVKTELVIGFQFDSS